jgi:proline racemase
VLQALDLSDQPTRIVVNGYPELQGSTLLEKRRFAREKHDDIRHRLAPPSTMLSVR